MKKLLIWDFDQTLADTSHLALYRASGRWDELLHAVRTDGLSLFGGIDSALIAAHSHGLRLAVVTSLPDKIAEELCNICGLAPEVLIGGTTSQNPKPSFDPMSKALKAANVKPWEAIAVGDRCIDTSAAHSAFIEDTIGALWGVKEPVLQRELRLSRPRYLAHTVQQLDDIISKLASGSPLPVSNIDEIYSDELVSELWLDREHDPVNRRNLDAHLRYCFCRLRYKGPWSLTVANALIHDFKLHGDGLRTDFLKKLRQRAIDTFATELLNGLPNEATVAFIPTSKVKGDPDYSDRIELLVTQVTKAAAARRKTLRMIEPVEVVESTLAVHQEEHSGDRRDPDEIIRHWRLNPSCLEGVRELFVVDDVLTSGGHFTAFARIVQSQRPDIAIRGMFWTVNTSAAHPSISLP